MGKRWRNSEDMANWPTQIDPPSCDCTECFIGQCVPLDRATDKQVRKMMAGKLRDATGQTFVVSTGIARATVMIDDLRDGGVRHHETLEWTLDKQL